MTNFNWCAVLFAAAGVATTADLVRASSTVRGGKSNNSREDHTSSSSSSSSSQQQQQQHRRHLLGDEEECVLYLKDMQFEDHITHKETWACEFTREQARRFGGQDIMDIEGVPDDVFRSRNIISGQAVMRTRGAFVVEQSIASADADADTNSHSHSNVVANVAKMVVPSEAVASVEIESLPDTDPRHQRQRRRQIQQMRRNNTTTTNNNRNLVGLSTSRTSGTLSTLVIRVVDSNEQAVASITQLKDDIFTDAVSMKTQFAACSHNQLIIQPASTGDGGIVEVSIDISAVNADHYTLETKAKAQAEALYGGSDGLASKYDLVLFCQPPGSQGSWIAYAYINRWDSFYNDYWCQRVSTQMHEIGHNIGFAHSGKDGNEYGDTSAMMGYSYNDDDGPMMCFNAAKNYQIGWYDLQKQSIDPLSGPDSKTFIFTGVGDYKTDGSNKAKLITLRIEQYGYNNGIDYYIGYNRQSGPNTGTQSAADKIVIFKKYGQPDLYGSSTRVADLSVGEKYVIENFKDTIYDVHITFLYVSDNDKRYALVSVSREGGFPTESPTTSCGTATNGRMKIELKTDSYGFETTWTVREQTSLGLVVQSDRQYEGNMIYSFPNNGGSVCLDPGVCYQFQIQDTFGDGICCSQGDGYYKLFLDGTQVMSGGQFGGTETRSFCVTGDTAPNCEDDPDFRFNNDPTKSCKDWVGRGSNNLSRSRNVKRIKKKCRKYHEGTRVWKYCPKTCALVGLGKCARR
eukprot:jgi/Psemu1/26265/gm1.26265_g